MQPLTFPKQPLLELYSFVDLVTSITHVLNKVPDSCSDQIIVWYLEKGDICLRSPDFDNKEDRTIILATTVTADLQSSLTDIQHWALEGLAARYGIESVEYVEREDGIDDEDAYDEDEEDDYEEQEGEEAFRAGKDLSANPYLDDSDNENTLRGEYVSWNLGWEKAKRLSDRNKNLN